MSSQEDLPVLGQNWPPGHEKTAVLIPAFNEARFIGSVVLQARQFAAQVLVVDDGSSDETPAIARAAGAQVLLHPQNLGKGAALNTGFGYLLKNSQAEVVVLLDGDGQHDCREIPHLIRPILADQADVVVGSRFLEKKSNTPWWRVFGQQALTLATNLGAQTLLTDSQSGFRAISRKTLNVFTFNSRGFSVESEMQFVIQRAGLRVLEVPITVTYSDPPKRNPIFHGLQVTNGLLRLIGLYRPLLFFGSAGFVLLTLGLFWGGYVIHIYLHVHTLAVGYALISVLLTILGSLSLLTGLLLHSVSWLADDIKKTIIRTHKPD